MLEESLKAIEGPVASRKNQARQQWPTGTVYTLSNISSEIKHRAAGQVLKIDVLVCEDNIKHNKTHCYMWNMKMIIRQQKWLITRMK